MSHRSKAPYNPPELRSYGTIDELTLTAGGKLINDCPSNHNSQTHGSTTVGNSCG